MGHSHSHHSSQSSSSSSSTHSTHASQSTTSHSSHAPSQTHDVLPKLSAPHDWESEFLHVEQNVKFLSSALPSKDFRHEWKLLYSSRRHGKSYNRFCFHTTLHGPTLIIIRDKGGACFGGFADQTWIDKNPKFYGEGNCFVFSLTEKQVYRATGLNNHYQWMNQGMTTLFNGVGMGGQENYFGWAIDDSFDTGTCRGTPTSTTFGNPILSSTQDWEVDVVEVWEVKEIGTLTYEQEKMLEKKNKTKSILDDEDNADKVIGGLLGHEFSNEDKVPDIKKKDEK